VSCGQGRPDFVAAKAPKNQITQITAQINSQPKHSERERERLDSSVTVPRENKPERYRKINIKSAKSMHKQQESIYIYKSQ
jgi:hypothetical protein